VRAKIQGTAIVPRLCVSRSNQHIYAQLIDDEKGHTMFMTNDSGLKDKGKVLKALQVGRAIARKAVEKGIKSAVFDRSGFKYHGRVKAVAEGAREGGLKF